MHSEAENLLLQRQRENTRVTLMCALPPPVEDPSVVEENQKSLGRKNNWSAALSGADCML